jgi:uncharacterized protein (TIGR00730 family)
VIRSLCVYCGSNSGSDPAFAAATRELARHLVERDVRVVYGGGAVGLMGTLADATLAAGGTVVGVIPQALMDREIGHRGLTELHVVASMHERKALMADLADAFVALPGGIGTLEELIEAYTWSQLGIHAKPCGVLDAGGFYGSLLALLDHMVREGFLREAHRDVMLADPDPARLLDRLEGWTAPAVHKWIDLDRS